MTSLPGKFSLPYWEKENALGEKKDTSAKNKGNKGSREEKKLRIEAKAVEEAEKHAKDEHVSWADGSRLGTGDAARSLCFLPERKPRTCNDLGLFGSNSGSRPSVDGLAKGHILETIKFYTYFRAN